MRCQIDAEIAAAKAVAARRLALLREKQRRDRERLDARILAILRNRLREADFFAVEAEARDQLDAETAERSSRARISRHHREAI
jgi:hypothetical protein